MSRTTVKELREGDSVSQVFLLRDCQFNTTKKGQPYARLLLGDATGEIVAMYWDLPNDSAEVLKRAKYVLASGTVNIYQNAPQFRVVGVAPAEVRPEDAVDFLPQSAKDAEELFSRLREIMALVENEHLRKFMEVVFADTALCEKLRRAPAASRMHHAYIGGLLEHTLSMAEAALQICGCYEGLSRDLLLSGVLIHDIGKVDEFVYETVIEYSDRGRLVGHIAMGIGIIEEKAAMVKGFPEGLLDVMRHYILSHHGQSEFGALRQPMTAEALALHYIDNLDAKLTAFFKAASEEPVGGGDWTPWQRMFESYLYTGDVLGGGTGPETEGKGDDGPEGERLFK